MIRSLLMACAAMMFINSAQASDEMAHNFVLYAYPFGSNSETEVKQRWVRQFRPQTPRSLNAMIENDGYEFRPVTGQTAPGTEDYDYKLLVGPFKTINAAVEYCSSLDYGDQENTCFLAGRPLYKGALYNNAWPQ